MVAKKGLYPLSYPQKGIWYLEKMYPSTSMANISATLKFETKLDIDAANAAFNNAVRTNDALRLRITEVDGEPFQYINEYNYIKFDVLDFSNKDIKDLYEWDSWMNDQPIYGLDEPLFYLAVVKISDNMAGFFAKLHHLIADAWTLVTLGNELIADYFRVLNNLPLNQAQKPSYLEYLTQEQQYFLSDRFIKDESFWLEKFDKIPELTALKTRKLLSTSLDASRKTFVLPKKLSEKIRPHCEEHKTSIFSLYMGAMAVYINRTKGLNKIVFGTPVLNRRNVKEKETIGMYISTVPIIVDVDDSQTYSTFTETINAEWMSLLRHQKYPYMLLLKKLREKKPGLEKLYDIVISYQNAKFIKTGADHFQEGRWHQNKVQTETLYIHINDREDDGEIIIDYDFLTQLFYPKEIEFLHDHVIRLLWHFIDNPNKQLPFIEMISETEKKKILQDFNDTKADFGDNLPVHKLFEKTVRNNPDKIALVFENSEISFRELNELSNRVAWKLIENGIRAGDIVGFMLSRSSSTIIAMLGILKAGAAYMPIDRNFPSERVTYILENSNARALIIEKGIYRPLEYNGSVLDIHSSLESESNTKNPDIVIQADDPVIVIYTSGSTGLPKGVEIAHRSIMNFIPAMTSIVNFDPAKTFVSITSESFDIFFFETLLPLTQGLRVLMTNENEQRIPQMLHELLLRYKVDMIQTTPTRMNYIINHLGHYAGFEELTDIILGGEVFKDTLLEKLKNITKAQIFNGYGPSETTIYSTFKELTNSDVINIGKPIPNTRIYIVDKFNNLMPIGTAGELCITGDGVMNGYINNDVLNKERLVECPFEPGNMMFKTGDLAYWYSQGDIEFIGRNDNQVKINGLRIEYGEIETNLVTYPGISEAVVTAWESDTGNPQLCAYYISETEIPVKALRDKLSEKLPSYMVPSYFIRLTTMPMTTSGKIARNLLPEPIYNSVSGRTYEPPSDKLEKVLADTYASILNHSEIGINDHFFELGGDSIGVIELVSQLYKKGYGLEIGDVYKSPILKELKKHVSHNRLHIIKPSYATTDLGLVDQDIFEQIKAGSLPPLDSAAITYLPDNDQIWPDSFYDKPVIYKYMSLNEGNIGVIAIPLGINQLYNENKKTIEMCVEAVRIAESAGARTVSLTGLIPSATDTGKAIEEAVKKSGLKALVTTGHSTTAATVILSIIRILGESNRNLADENVCVLGIGSIGSAVTKLMTAMLPHPNSIVLCDLPSRMGKMQELRKDLINEFGFMTNINLAYSDGTRLPNEVYKSTLIIGATNAPDVLDIEQLVPGTIIVDDSGPHCFSPVKAMERILSCNDLLITEGGVLEVPGSIKNRLYLPIQLDNNILSRFKSHFVSDKHITGCILSGLLSSTNEHINATIGNVDINECIKNYQELIKSGYRGAELHFEDFVFPEMKIRSFKTNHKNSLVYGTPIDK